ncbi:Rho guanine nucleotide exchange factor 39 [Bagarius yarrelli]|uniref:Rho guanine nucleotide exchange factor 39 n=1 Tax=Bagarius yarrelli TaxID=175774 RepID=A0A556THG1_BAGYA|nr:Rho guanine nucleotide exchange factor 39 [Bagarius yarrelli]
MSFSPSPCVPAGVRSVQEQRDRWERKRKRTGRELVQSEQRYCEKLELISTYFVEILKAKGTLRQDIRESIFSSIKSINLVNQKLLSHLENGNFGGGFDQFCPHLHFYTTYADNFHTAQKILATALVSPSHVYCHDCPVKSHFGTRLSVPAIGRLQMGEDCSCLDLMEGEKEKKKRPREALRAEINVSCQCTPRYNHFLKDLTENTSPGNPEFQQLSSRWYIREGWLKTVPPKGKETKPKMFFLFSDILVQAKRCSPMHPTNGDKLSCQRIYPLKECTVDKVFGHTKSQGGLISLTFSKAKLLLMSSHQEDINDWYCSLCLAIGVMAVHRGLTVRSLLAAGPVPKAPARGSVISHRAGQVAVAEVRGEPQEEEKKTETQEHHRSAQEGRAAQTAAPRSHTQPAEHSGLVPNSQQEEGYGQGLTPSHTLNCKEKCNDWVNYSVDPLVPDLEGLCVFVQASEQGNESGKSNNRPPAGESSGSTSKKIKLSEAPSGRYTVASLKDDTLFNIIIIILNKVF